MTIDDIKQKLNNLNNSLQIVKDVFPLQKLTSERSELLSLQESPNFFDDLKNAQKVGKQIASLDKKIEDVKYLTDEYDLLCVLAEETKNEDVDAVNQLDAMLIEFEKKLEKTRLTALLTGKYDKSGAILTVQAGAGGTEACDWAEMLLRMYQRYVAKQGYKYKVLDITSGDGAGIKGATILIEGENVYGFLKAERGVHRLVRISPFDSNARRHTSFASVEVMPEIENENEIEIKPDDIRVDVFRSGGHGGQGVNTTDSAVRIKHIPTGIVVQCQNERSQIQNRENAMNVLRARLAALEEEKQQQSLQQLQGSLKKIEWGSQIRSYVFCPYTMVKDHRTDYETSDVNAVMDGDLQPFIEEYLKKLV